MKVYQLQTNAEKIDDFFNNEGNCLLDIVNILPESFDIQIKGEEELIHYNVRPFNQKICVGSIHFNNDDIITIQPADSSIKFSSDPTLKTIIINSAIPANQTVKVQGESNFDSNATISIISNDVNISITHNNNDIYIGSSLTPMLGITDQGSGIYEITIP